MIRGLLIALLCLPVHSAAQGEAAKISEVEVRGLLRVDKGVVESNLRTEAGRVLDPETVTEDIKRLWRTGLFRDIEIRQAEGPNGPKVLVLLKEKPTIRAVRLEGNRGLKDDDLEEAANLRENSMLNLDTLQEALGRIREKATDKGYFLTQVDYRLEEAPGREDLVEVVFEIKEHGKVTVRDLTLYGNDKIPSSELQRILATKVGNELSIFGKAGRFRAEELETDVLRLQSYYWDKGFVTVQIAKPNVQLSADRRSIFISIGIEEGEQYQVGDIGFGGEVAWFGDSGSVTSEQLESQVRLEKGETFSRTALLEDMQRVTDAYRNIGFAYANVSPDTVPRTVEGVPTVDVVFQVQRGELIDIGEIRVTGNTKTRDKVVRREMAIVEGDRYSWEKLQRSKARIFRLGYFETVEIVSKQTDDPAVVDLEVEIKEKSTGTFQVGAGFASGQGPIFNAQVTENNFLGNGQLVALNANLATGRFARRFAQLQLFEPRLSDSKFALSIDGYWTDRFERGYTRESRGVSPGLQYPLGEHLRASVGYTAERVSIEPTDNLGAGADLFNLDLDGFVSSVRTGLLYDSRDNMLFPTKGQYHQAQIEFAEPGLGTAEDLQYKRVSLVSRFFHPLVGKFILRLNTELGYVFSGGPRGVPISERYAAGGIFQRGPRGYDFRALGPTVRSASSNGALSGTQEFVVGGNKQVLFNAEVEFPIIQQAGIKGVVFTDAGNALGEDEGWFYLDTDEDAKRRGFLLGSNREITLPLGLYPSAGFGLRWLSPMGPLRFEWGIPIVKRTENDRVPRFDFAIGNFF